MKEHNKDTFLEYRKKQESDYFKLVDHSNPISSILTVELNTTELCNRTCIFCPRYDKEVYPNRNLNMSAEDAEIIANNLSEFSYKGKISFSGYSENFLNKKFADIILVMRKHLSESLFECNTNGDFLKKDYARRLFDNGLDLLYINLYDGIDQIEKFLDIMNSAQISRTTVT